MNSHPKYRFYRPLSIPGIVTPDSNVILDATPNHIVFRGVLDFTDATFIGLPDGGVSGPDTSLMNSVARFAGTTGKVIKDSGVIIDDNANITCNSIKIGSNVVLTENALGSNVTSSSLTSVGVLQNLQVDDILIDSNIIGTINGVDLHIHSATGNIFIDNFATPNSILSIDANSKIVAASNSIYLKEIDQNLSTTSSPTFVSINGTILTASQPNITSLGTLTSLNVSGDVSLLSLTPNSYLVLDGSNKVVAASNSSNLASIDQNLGTSSTVTFANIVLPRNGYIKFRDDYPGEFNYGIHWRSTSWDLRVFLDKVTENDRGVSFGHYEDNDMDKPWTEYVRIKNNGTITLNGLNADTVLSLDSNKSIIGEVRGTAFNKNFGNGQNDVPRGWWVVSGSYLPTIDDSSNITGAAFNSAHYCRMHKMIHINATVTIAASTQNATAWISFAVPVIDAFDLEYQVNGMAVAQTASGQESHPARIIALEGSKHVRMSWWSTTTDTVRWSILLSILDTGDV